MVNTNGLMRRYGDLLFYPVFLASVYVLARPLTATESFAFALLALAWFAFGRLLILVFLAALFRKRLSLRTQHLLGSAFVDAVGILVVVSIDSRLAWSVLVAAVITELIFW